MGEAEGEAEGEEGSWLRDAVAGDAVAASAIGGGVGIRFT